MIIAVNYRVHDYEPNQYVIDTTKFDLTSKFQSELSKVCNQKTKNSHYDIDGNKYSDIEDVYMPNKVLVKLPATIERFINVWIRFE